MPLISSEKNPNLHYILNKKISLLHGVTPRQATLLAEELKITTFGELLYHFPYRYEDRSTWHSVAEIDVSLSAVQCKGRLGGFQWLQRGKKRILTAPFTDQTGTIRLVWLNGVNWIEKKLIPQQAYVLFGKPSQYQQRLSIVHPTLEPILNLSKASEGGLRPLYHTTSKLKQQGLDSKGIARLQEKVLRQVGDQVVESLPPAITSRHSLLVRKVAFEKIHFPDTPQALAEARKRFKFEEVFYLQLQVQRDLPLLAEAVDASSYSDTALLKEFYSMIPFTLTEAQKRVMREIYHDITRGKQMNRLLQGDVGSGKTIVAFMSMLLPIAHGAQVALMAPTEILANQHYQGLSVYASKLGIAIALLTGSTRQKERKKIHEELAHGSLKILVGTHALLEDAVQFSSLGLVIIDEQHRFGVEQRAKLWRKNSDEFPPHLLVMTATPIPRTLAMTFYSHLDLSVIDELPPTRKPVETYCASDCHRLRVLGFIRKQVGAGRQAYIVYPRIEESSDASYKDLMDGYESICRAFPGMPIAILHGRMTPQAKRYEMERFVRGETKIMVATTVIEVGVDVPNATVMVIENADRFGLSQLHQLRGRVGRGGEKSYCILMTGEKVSAAGRIRIDTMVETSDGFKIADVDLRLRGPGNLMGVAQSGLAPLKLVDFSQDQHLIRQASQAVKALLSEDALLTKREHAPTIAHLSWLHEKEGNWLQVG